MKMIKRWLRKRKYRKVMLGIAWLFLKIDRHMEAEKWPKWRREQFYRDIVKSPAMRKKIFSDMILQLDGKKGGKRAKGKADKNSVDRPAAAFKPSGDAAAGAGV